MTVIDKVKDIFTHDRSPAPAAADSTAPAPTSTSVAPAAAQPTAEFGDAPVFDDKKVTVIFVLGGPGAGKGTQCERLVKDYGFVHLSAGDLLRAEQQRPGSTYGAMIKEYITEGKIVPMEVTVKLLENAMRDALKAPPKFADAKLTGAWQGGRGRFLIDGFPRKMDQAIKFDEAVVKSTFVLFFATTEAVMLERLLERGKTSGRDDDNRESITKRFKTFEETSMPVVDYYRKRDQVVEVDSSPPVDVVYEHVRVVLDQRLGLVDTAPSAVASQPTQSADEPVLGKPIA
ncbi:bifunctional uridylate/adenylate kinase [Cryptotrichosporon argae]